MKRTIFAALLALGTTPVAAQEMNVQELAEAMFEACEDHRNGEDVFFMYSIGERYCRDVPEDRPDFSISMRDWDETPHYEPDYRQRDYYEDEDSVTAEIIDEMGDMMETIVAAPKTNTVYVPVPAPMPRATTPTRKVTTTRTPTRKVTTTVSPKPKATTRTAPKPKATTRTASKPKPKAKAKRTTTRKTSTKKKKR